MDDPFGESIHNKLLSTYLAGRKGNCVSMPLLFIILGQRLGIDVTAATVPNHLFVKYRDDEFPMTDEALANGVYMRPLTRKETVVVMVGTLLEFYGERRMPEHLIAMARLAHEYAPRDVSVILHLHSGYLWYFNLIVNRHAGINPMPAEKRTQARQLDATLRALYERAYALGWRPLDEAAEARYRQTAERARAAQQPKEK